ncbi:MAG: ATP-grasp domain-containing protein [Acidimicrobiia bacterium]
MSLSKAVLAASDLDRFRELQASLSQTWPYMTTRRLGDTPRTLIVVNSMNMELPAHMYPVIPAYEERFLFLMLAAVKNPGTRVIYVTSQPILPRLVDYYMSLMPGSRPPGLDERVELVSAGDGSARPLIDKILERPLLLQRLKNLATASPFRVIVPFNTTEKEVLLGNHLDTPVYGPDPTLAFLGSKSGSRQVFAEAGIPYPDGVEGVFTLDDLIAALEKLRVASPSLRAAMVKLDDLAGGLGNALVRLEGVDSESDLRRRIQSLEVEDQEVGAEAFLAALARRGGIVEERIEGEDFRSPSVQLRASPFHQVEVLSTHDQVLGGATGQTFLGCRFPADSGYGVQISELGARVGQVLANKGVIGRFGIDFVVVRRDDVWQPYAIEINLRNGGTTHPMLTLSALTDGEFDPLTNTFPVEGGQRFYVATDHLEDESYRTLTTDDVLDRIEDQRLSWSEETKTGVALHLVSAVAVAGRLGITAVGTSSEDAGRRYQRAGQVIAELAGAGL